MTIRPDQFQMEGARSQGIKNRARPPSPLLPKIFSSIPSCVLWNLFYFFRTHLSKGIEMKTLLLFLWGVLLLTGCAAQTITQQTIRTDDIRGIPVVQNPVIADLDVKANKVTGKATLKQPINEEMGKQNAIADALDKSQADILIQPVFRIETTGNTTTITVTGFPGNYKDFRPMDSTDIKRLSAIDATKKVDAYEPAAVTEKTSYAGVILAIIAGLAGAITLIVLLN
jgi:hypothetical protein